AFKYRQPEVPPCVLVSSRIIAGSDADGATESCRITVEDNGIGFAAESAERIFGLFQRLHGRGRHEGAGIGLAVCKRIVERHGGTIIAESSPGMGARFIVTLPVQGPAVDDFQQLACTE
ncbi:MAG: sensor histidine kinase, partial [Desulfurivibrionaceae bacterium]